MGPSSVLVFGSLVLGITSAFPLDMPVVRPNHYLQQGTFAKEQHILPQSFYTPHHPQVQNVESDLRKSASSNQPQQQVAPAKPTDATPPASSSDSSSSGEPSRDSYLPVVASGSGSLASTLTNTNEYGEQVPKAFSNLQQDSYAYYHGQNN